MNTASLDTNLDTLSLDQLDAVSGGKAKTAAPNHTGGNAGSAAAEHDGHPSNAERARLDHLALTAQKKSR